MLTRLPPKAAEVINTLRRQGVRLNFINKVDHRWELYYFYTRLDGKEHHHFVAEVDSYGNVVDYGPYMEKPKKDNDIIYNADGETIKVSK